ncbi:SDR family oxidoreductase [Thalassotalea sp. Y01]|uniref:SDR family oxidoreductase n=1 Tax=Thalassotalea sp. Y01 TaxID=2729613 RepID=UPI00145D67D9|nr:SDR family oxidoreductase [Thalassotalea sp. Y01]NMP15485.1 SDR family oxidoreductase [Thalassotalea sp. Y01]
MSNLFSVKGKTAIVTGGSRSIGKMISKGLVEHGVKTYITARNEAQLQATAIELSNLVDDSLCIPIVADLSSLEGINAFVETIKQSEEKIDILINNAGATWGASFTEFPEVGWDKVMNLNAKSPFFLTQKLLPLLSHSAHAEHPSRVVNIASINAFNNPRMSNYSYSASKAAVVQMTRHLAADLVKKHININAIAPGFFLSKMTKYAVENKQTEQFVKQMVPKERLGNGDDIAGSVIYLCSKASNWMTGHTLVLDGGVIASSGYGEYSGFLD